MRFREIIEADFAVPKSKYLYHGTSIYGLLSIITDDTIHVMGSDGYHGGISLTRSRDMAEYFAYHAERSIERTYSFDEPGDGIEVVGAVIIFDRERLSNQVGLAPVQWNRNDMEKEERTIGSIRPAFASAVGIMVKGHDLKHYYRLMKDETFENEFDQSDKTALAKLMISPLRKRWVAPSFGSG